jgi:hypothetical protein
MGKAKRPGYYGECVWMWKGTKKKGKWVRDPLAMLLGIDCKNGGTCVDANTLGVQGKPLDWLIVMCKKDHGAGCDACTCTYTWGAGGWVRQSNNCGKCGANCGCTSPNMIRKWGKVRANIRMLQATCVTWCH